VHIYVEISQWSFLYSYIIQVKMSFFQNVEQEGKTGAAWVFALWEGRCMERKQEGDYGGNIMHSYVKC
jgi:hypothetical protein